MLLIGFCYGIRSERRLCDEVALNLAYRWFCRLDLDGEVPDHSTFSKNRHGHFRDSDLFRRVFERVVRRCMADGLVGGAVDASVVEADASRFKRVAAAPPEWSEPEKQTRAVREYLEALDTEASPNNPDREPRALSPSDPCSAWRTKGRLRVQFAYGINYLIDVQQAVIVDVEATPARISKEVASTTTMLERTAERLGLWPKRIAGDQAYGTGPLLGWLVERRIDPHITVWDKSERRDGTLACADFTYDAKGDAYFCPRGKILTTTGKVTNDTLYYRSSTYDCATCGLSRPAARRVPTRVSRAMFTSTAGIMPARSSGLCCKNFDGHNPLWVQPGSEPLPNVDPRNFATEPCGRRRGGTRTWCG